MSRLLGVQRHTISVPLAVALVLGAFALTATRVSAAQVDSLPPDSLAADALLADSGLVVAGTSNPGQEIARSRPGRPSPSGAFLRSLVLPGWGQAASGAYSRAVFYVLLESSSVYMLVKTQRTLTAARQRVTFREEAATRRAMESGLSDPDSIQAFLEADEEVEDARALEESRTQQREDWIAFGLAMLLLGGADAFVSAHLSDFPEALTVEARGLPDGSHTADITVALPWSPTWLGGRQRGN